MATVSYTRSDLVNRALDNLGVLATGQTPSDDDVSKVDKLLDATLDNLSAREVVYVADAGLPGPTGGSIDPAIFLDLAIIIANRAAPAFGLGDDAILQGKALMAEEDLRVVGRPARTRRLLRTDHVLRRGNRRFWLGNFTNGT